jgi:hypothetical protein
MQNANFPILSNASSCSPMLTRFPCLLPLLSLNASISMTAECFLMLPTLKTYDMQNVNFPMLPHAFWCFPALAHYSVPNAASKLECVHL